ncbi:MAG TPA: hypothetical protein VMH00_04395 [Candidatus Limnocylindrales bacterium]|nr:hypothetical protein [Candidatus Limnocylindrales bacterium]
MSTPPVQPPAPPPPKSNKVAWWILGILCGGLFFLIIVGLTVVGLVIRHVNVRDSGNRVDIQTPVGELKVNKDAAHATELPVYPGAQVSNEANGGSADVSFGDQGLGIAAEAYETRDSLNKVREWYSKQLGPEFRLEKGSDERVALEHAHFEMGDQDFAFVDDRGDGARVVALKIEDGRVKITLLRLGKREPQ